MGPKTKFLSKEIELSFLIHSIRLVILVYSFVKIGWKMAKLWPWEARAPKWHLASFVPIDGHFGQVFEIWTSNLFCPGIYINFDIQTKFEVNQTQIDYSIPKKSFITTLRVAAELYIPILIN